MTTLNRRELCLALAGATCLSPAVVSTAWAQPAPVAGKEYLPVSPPVPVAGAGKVEVVEFFWYGCPHCNALEPTLNDWLKKLPADVSFHRVPVGFTPSHEYHQKIYYALEALGKAEALHAKVFAAIHVSHKRMDKDEEVAAFMSANGLDGAKVVEAMKSFSVLGKARQAKQLSLAYHIDGVPMLGIQGRYITSASLTGSAERMFAVADALIAQSRK
jgi:thiol:disulfide interchange protein DsbA